MRKKKSWFTFPILSDFNSPSLEFVESVDLFAHLGYGVVVLLAQNGQRRFVLNVGLLEISAEFAELGLTFLVQLDLSGSGTASLLQTFAEFLELAGEIAALLLGLGTSAAFSLDLEKRNANCLVSLWSENNLSLFLEIKRELEEQSFVIDFVIQTSSSSSSMRACSSLICFCNLPTRDCSSSSLAVSDESSLSLRWMVCSSSFLFLSRSATASCVSFRSPSTFLFAFSTSAL